MGTITLTLVTDPGKLGLDPVTTHHWVSPNGGRAIRQRAKDAWWWRNEDGSEGICPDRDTACTMLAFHTPELSDLTAVTETAEPCEP